MKNIPAASFDMDEAGRNLPLMADLLLAWYHQNARVLPWREKPEPYWIWTSEIMLQQTRLEVVLPYFHRFVESLPDIPALAKAEESLLLKLWEGLGYYNRVRNMQKAARIVMECYGGELPASYQHLLDLPGIGEYTAGAIASMAYQIPVPAVDGNVLRVMARLLGCRGDITEHRVRKALGKAVEAILPRQRPGDFNQAMMDLGAMVCLPNTSPCCSRCPLTSICTGYKEDIASSLPVKSSPKLRIKEQKTVLVLVSQGKTLLRRRPGTGLLAGMWEFPNLEGWLSENNVVDLLEEWGLRPLTVRHLAEARHIFTHREWHLRGYLIEVADTLLVQGALWVKGPAVREEYAIPSAFKSFARHLDQWIKLGE